MLGRVTLTGSHIVHVCFQRKTGRLNSCNRDCLTMAKIFIWFSEEKILLLLIYSIVYVVSQILSLNQTYIRPRCPKRLIMKNIISFSWETTTLYSSGWYLWYRPNQGDTKVLTAIKETLSQPLHNIFLLSLLYFSVLSIIY